jgi:hypothetical protein
MQSKAPLSKRGGSVVGETLNSPNPQQTKRLTEGNLDVFKANVADANAVMRSPTIQTDAISSINSQYVSNRLRKYTEQLLNPKNVQPTNKFNETMTQFTTTAAATNNLQLQPIQYDYLKRFIKQLEDETLSMHRQAKQRKMLN